MYRSDDSVDSPRPSDTNCGRLVTPHDLAELLGVSTRTLYRWIDRGQLIRPLRLGGVLRWRWRDVTQWLEEQAP